jgi:cytochrome d ubiquinol oxidase subunit II
MRSIAPVWDTATRRGSCWAVPRCLPPYPRAHAMPLSALYVLLSAMLLALLLRGVAFEFHFKAHRWQFVRDGVFAAGNTLATFFQGITLGAAVDPPRPYIRRVMKKNQPLQYN